MAGAATLSPQMQRDGVAVPANIVNQPSLPIDLIIYLDAFYDLDTDRNYELGRIPWSKILRYGEHYDMNTEDLFFFIRKMDDAHLANKASKTNGGSQGPRTPVQRPPRPD